MPEDLSPDTGLTLQQKKLIKYVILCSGNVAEAARRIDMDVKHAQWLMRQEKIDTVFQRALLKAGITSDFVAQRLKEGCDAEYPEKKSATTGIVIQEKSPDFFTRHKYIDSIINIRGDKAPEKTIEEKRVINITVSDETLKGLADAGKIDKAEIPVIMGELQHVPIREGNNVPGRGREEKKEEKGIPRDEKGRFRRSPKKSKGKSKEDKQDLRGDGGREGDSGSGKNPQEKVEEALQRLKNIGRDSKVEVDNRGLEGKIIQCKSEAEGKNPETDR